MNCLTCEKNLDKKYLWITWNNEPHCEECFELISGRKAEMRCLN